MAIRNVEYNQNTKPPYGYIYETILNIKWFLYMVINKLVNIKDENEIIELYNNNYVDIQAH